MPACTIAEGTIYRDVDKRRTDKAQRERYPLELEGNFGGIALTNWVYDASRRMLMDIIAAYGLNVVNCGDGALISGASPRVPDAVEVDGPVIDRRRVVAEIACSMVHYRQRHLVPAETLAELRGKSHAMFVGLRGILAGFDVDGADFPGVHAAIRRFLDEAEASYAPRRYDRRRQPHGAGADRHVLWVPHGRAPAGASCSRRSWTRLARR